MSLCKCGQRAGPTGLCSDCFFGRDPAEGSLARPAGSAWARTGVVMAEADKLEELIQLKLQNPGMTREAALEWALEMRRLYSPNVEISHDRERKT